MPDKWDSPDGQTHDESDVVARVKREAELHGDDEFCKDILFVLARLDAAERRVKELEGRTLSAIRRVYMALPDPEKLRLLADWFDKYDAKRRSNFCHNFSENDQVQAELRTWAANIEALLSEYGD